MLRSRIGRAEEIVGTPGARLDLGASSEDRRRVLAVLRFLDQPG